MRDRNRTAVGNLIFEFGNDAAATTEDIAKANDGECVLGSACGVEDYHFGETFSCTIDARRANGFISGDEDKAFNIVSNGDLREIVRAENVVGDGFDNIGLHERDMFVGSGMEDDLRLML